MAKVAVVYWSGTGNTQKMAEAVVEGAKGAGAEVECFEVDSFSVDQIDGFDGLALGCPSMGAEELEEGSYEPFFAAAVDSGRMSRSSQLRWTAASSPASPLCSSARGVGAQVLGWRRGPSARRMLVPISSIPSSLRMSRTMRGSRAARSSAQPSPVHADRYTYSYFLMRRVASRGAALFLWNQ